MATSLRLSRSFDHVFLQTFQRGVFMQHAVDLDLDDGRTGDRRQQDAPQRIAQCVAVTALQRLDDDLGVVGTDRLDA